MRVLVIGSGAREHALVARLAAERDVARVVCAPATPASPRSPARVPVDLADPDGARSRSPRASAIDLTVVGPELPLEPRRRRSLRRRGPAACSVRRRAAARLESSKAFAKEFMARHGVPTARFRTCESPREALRVVRSGEFGFPVVLKADGLAAGKGVVIAEDRAAAEAAVRAAMRERQFGAAGDRIVIEECLTGPEVSFFVALRRRARAADRHPRRITSASSTTTAGRTPAAWARSRRARCSTPRSTRASCARSSSR